MAKNTLSMHDHSEIIENLVDGLFTVDTNRVITSWNKAAEAILGYKEENVLGRKCDFFKSPTCMGALLNNDGVCPLFSEEKIVRRRCVVTAKNGEDKYLLKNAQILKDKQGKVIGGVESIVDITELIEREREIDLLKQEIKGRKSFYQLIGNHYTMQNIYSLINLAKDSNASVLIQGERGTGKELVARTIHFTGQRKTKPFVKIACSALTAKLMEGELFGHTDRSSIEAESNRKGKLEEADGGTLFLDEITDMPLSLQAQLVKVFREKQKGATALQSSQTLDVRLIAATEKSIQELTDERTFSKELFDLVNEISLCIPPLRERKTDIPLLVEHFIKRLRAQGEKAIVKCDQNTIDLLMKYNWLGNVRELENTIEYAFVTCRTDTIRSHNIPQQIKQQLALEGELADLKRDKTEERLQIVHALEAAQGSKTKAAQLLGYSRVTLWKKMKKLGIGA
jgi:PAS domain S-box-containing protein